MHCRTIASTWSSLRVRKVRSICLILPASVCLKLGTITAFSRRFTSAITAKSSGEMRLSCVPTRSYLTLTGKSPEELFSRTPPGGDSLNGLLAGRDFEKIAVMSTAISSLLASSPEICGGRLRIEGTRITVNQIAALYKQGCGAEE